MIDLITISGRDSIPAYLFCSIDMSWAQALMSKLAEKGSRVTVTAILIKAIALAQRAHPLSRSIILPWGKVVDVPNITAGFTVEKVVDGQPTVYFGTIDDPVQKSVEQIAEELNQYKSAEITDLAQLAKQERFVWMPWLFRRVVFWLAKCIPAVRLKCFGATFGLSSLGQYGARWIAGPCVCTATFGVGTATDMPVVEGEAVSVKPMLALTLGFDHRVMDNRAAQMFLLEVRKLAEGAMESEVLSREE